MEPSKDIAILLFSRSAKGESYAKHWTTNLSVNFHIAKVLVSNTLDRLARAPFPIYQIDESLQHGNSFAERLTHAFEYVFDLGYKYVVAVGNDCVNPNIDWWQVRQQLTQQKAILGPDHRGGVYLIGLSKRIHFASIFKKTPWRSSKVFKQLSNQLNNCVFLDARQDINTFDDLVLHRGLFDKIKHLLKEIYHTSFKNQCIPQFSIPGQHLRAPPFPAFLERLF